MNSLVDNPTAAPVFSSNGGGLSKRRRICMITYSFYENDTRVMQYANALAKRGDEVDVVALARDKKMPPQAVLEGVTLYRIQHREINEKGLFSFAKRIGSFLLRATLFLRKQQKARPYDLIHIHNVPDFLVYAAVYPKLKGVPVILDIHDLLPEFYASKFKISHDSLMFRILTRFERYSAAFATHVIVANHIWCERYVRRSASTEKCSVVRNYPDLTVFADQHKEHRLQDGKLLFTYPGSLNWHQGLDVAIRAFARVADRIPEAEFHIYGEGPAKPSLIVLVRELNLEKRVVFHDFLSARAIARVMADTDIAIEPKRSTSDFGNEALSTKILEFMAVGVPVIASKTRIHAYYYDDSVVQYFENDDEAALAEQMVRLRNDPERRAELVANASRYVRENNWDYRKREYLDLVDKLISARMNASRTIV